MSKKNVCRRVGCGNCAKNRRKGGKHISRSSMAMTWKLCAALWLTCRDVQSLTGASLQSVSNLRREALHLRRKFPRLRIHSLSLKTARALVGRKVR
jgi:hypothetical protein